MPEGVLAGLHGRRPSCTVIISTRDRLQALNACLQSVRKQDYPDVEILVVDSAPQREPAEHLAGVAGARYLRLLRPGLSSARNAGASAARGDIVVFLDDDVTLERDCLASLIDEFSDSNTVVVGGRIVLSGGDPESRAAFESFGAFDPGPNRRVVDRSTESWFELVNFGGLGSGAMLAVRRSLFALWPGFDERLGRGALLDCSEELFAYFTVVDMGYRVVYTPHAVARHPAPASLEELRKRLLNSAAGAAAYLMLLLTEYPAHRSAALKYAWEALSGKQRQWRPRPATMRHALVPRWRERLAWLSGPLVYLRMRMRIRVPVGTRYPDGT